MTRINYLTTMLALLFVLFASTATAQTYDIGDYAGRPGVGTGTSVVPKNKLLWETGMEYNSRLHGPA